MPYASWGNYPRAQHRVRKVQTPDLIDLQVHRRVLPYGYGRSYGDVCLNDGGTLLAISALDRILFFDEASGVIRAEAGLSLAQLLDYVVPRGWFLKVTPGTKFVSLGGAVANDVHGKNHLREGTFGRHVRAFELLRSDGSRVVCTPCDNSELFRATVGGLGLTGVLLWVELALRPISSSSITAETIKFGNLAELFALSDASDADFEYTMAWIDCTSSERNFGRGIFSRGNHSAEPQELKVSSPPRLSVPANAPNFLLNRVTIATFNQLFYNKQLTKHRHETPHYEPFFYMLDAIGQWNRLYGSRGLIQYQFALPYSGDISVTQAIFDRIAASQVRPLLSVFKKLGAVESPGMLSFPKAGITLAFDFPNAGRPTFDLLDDLDNILVANGGRIYPAKDARMSASSFQSFFPTWRTFSAYIDPQFSSSFWRRVTKAL